MSIFWQSEGDDWIKRRNAYINSRLGPDPYQLNTTPDVYNPDLDRQYAEWKPQWDALQEQFKGTLTPEERADMESQFAARTAGFDKSNKIGKGLALGIIGASGIGAGLTGAGLIGGAAPVSAGAIEAAAGIPELGLAAQTGLSPSAAAIAGAAGFPELGMAAQTGGAAGGGGLLSQIGSGLGSVGSWAAKNPGLVSLLGGTLAAAGSKPSTPQQSQTFAPQPGLQMGSLQQRPMDQSPGLLSTMNQPMRQNSGLARFGATGGLFQPGAYTPQAYQWGK